MEEGRKDRIQKLLSELGKVVPQAYAFRACSALYFLEPEGAILWGGGFVPSLLYAAKKVDPDPRIQPEIYMWFGGIAACAFLLCSFADRLNEDIHLANKHSKIEMVTGTYYSQPLTKRKALQEEIDYVEKALGRDR